MRRIGHGAKSKCPEGAWHPALGATREGFDLETFGVRSVGR